MTQGRKERRWIRMNGTRSRWSQTARASVLIRLDEYLTRRAVLMDKDKDASDFLRRLRPL